MRLLSKFGICWRASKLNVPGHFPRCYWRISAHRNLLRNGSEQDGICRRALFETLSRKLENSGGVVFMVSLDSDKFDALSVWASEMPPLIFANENFPGDRLRFSLAHELGHLLMHTNPSPKQEEEADRFASEFLMPADEIEPQLTHLGIERPRKSEIALEGFNASVNPSSAKPWNDHRSASQNALYENECERLAQERASRNSV